MSGAVATAAAWMAGGMVVSSMLAPKPNIPAPQAPITPPQASSAPQVQGVQAAMGGTGQAGGAPGAASTMLTGAGGVDPNSLSLGKKTLLGG